MYRNIVSTVYSLSNMSFTQTVSRLLFVCIGDMPPSPQRNLVFPVAYDDTLFVCFFVLCPYCEKYLECIQELASAVFQTDMNIQPQSKTYLCTWQVNTGSIQPSSLIHWQLLEKTSK